MRTNMIEVCRRQTGIEAAVEHAGSQRRLANLVGVSQQAVSLWVRQGYVPDRYVKSISEMTGLPVSALIRPDVVELVMSGVQD